MTSPAPTLSQVVLQLVLLPFSLAWAVLKGVLVGLLALITLGAIH